MPNDLFRKAFDFFLQNFEVRKSYQILWTKITNV